MKDEELLEGAAFGGKAVFLEAAVGFVGEGVFHQAFFEQLFQ